MCNVTVEVCQTAMILSRSSAMKKYALFVGVSLAVNVCGWNARGDEPKPEQIIDKAIRAHGGEEKLSGLTGFSLKERIVYEKGPTWTFEVEADVPHRYRSEMKSGPEGKNRSVIVINGEQGWLKRGDDVDPYPATFLDSMRKNTIPYLGPRSILRLKARQQNSRCQFSTAGECTIDGHQAVGLRMKLEDGPQQTWYFDKESGLLLKSESKTANFEGADTVSVTTYEDYQTIDGFPMARKERTERDGKPASTTELMEFKVATPSEGAFAKP
jgi:hypothetical protein